MTQVKVYPHKRGYGRNGDTTDCVSFLIANCHQNHCEKYKFVQLPFTLDFVKIPAFKDYRRVLVVGCVKEFNIVALGVTLIPDGYYLVKIFIAIDEPIRKQTVSAPFSVEY